MTTDGLQEAFEYVRKTFFPRWDKKRTWTVVHDPNLPASGQGLCDVDKKTISIECVYEDQEMLHNLLIHEICHAVTNVYHGKKWSARFLQASDTANKIGRAELSKKIREEVEGYADPMKCADSNAQTTYCMIEDAVLDDPDVSYENVIKYIGRDYGLHPDQVKKKYKRCRKVYEAAVRDRREMLEATKKLRSALRKR